MENQQVSSETGHADKAWKRRARATLTRLFSCGVGMLPDTFALRVLYLRSHRRFIRLNQPSTYTEKIQWLKLHDRDPRKAICADKLRVREYVAATLGGEFLIPLLAQTSDPERLDFEKLGPRYILKTNHGSGTNIVVVDDTMWIRGEHQALDYRAIRDTLASSLAEDYSLGGREWEYQGIERRVIAERLMRDESGNELLTDYKVHCFNGRAELIQVISDRQRVVKETWFDREWRRLHVHYFSPHSEGRHRPQELESLLASAEALARGFSYVRVDLYLSSGRVLFGEMTFHPAAGFMRWSPRHWDAQLGQMLELPAKPHESPTQPQRYSTHGE